MVRGGRPPGLLAGCLISIVFGTVFVEVNAGGLTGGWSTAIRITGAVVAIVLLAGVARAARMPTGAAIPGVRGFASRGYWFVVLGEAVVLFGGLAIINNVFGAHAAAVPWIAVVVGVHFIVLARVWRIAEFTLLGVAQVVFGIAGFVLAATGGSTAATGLVSGVLSGVALFVTAAVALGQALRSPEPAAAAPGPSHSRPN
jgi:hypothetical protein